MTRWTQDQEAKLRQMYDADTPASVIAKMLGRTTRAIYKRASVMGLTDPERSQHAAKAQRREGSSEAYRRGQERRHRGGCKVVPSGLTPAMASWWLAGWHDKDMEMGNSVIEEKMG